MQEQQPDNMTPADQGVADRLRRLSTMPMDVTRLESALRREIGDRPIETAAQPKMRIGWMRRWSAVAASIAVASVLVGAILFATSGGPVMASATAMAEFHRHLVEGKVHTIQVDSIESASRALAQYSPRLSELPEIPAEHVMACCLNRMGGKKLAGVLLKVNEVPVTMVVADAKDFESPGGFDRSSGYHIESSGTLNMVMIERSGRWVCLIGELPSEDLVQLADQSKF